MTSNSSLMAHLVPRLTPQVENAATDALAYILNSSDESRQALNDLIREGGLGMESIVRVATQVTYPDGSRPDMAGYDKNNTVRMLVEAKFWHTLSEDQTVGYAQLLDQPGPALLLIIAPEPRIPTLWAEIYRHMGEENRLELIDSPSGVRRAKIIWTEPRNTEVHLILVSWVRLLDRMEAIAKDDGTKSDIQQLKGFVQVQGDKAFLPVHSEELSPRFANRLAWWNQLVDDVVDSRGVPELWMDIKGYRATPQRFGYGRYFRFWDVERLCWFGINCDLWARSGDTPLWVSVGDRSGIDMDEIGRKLRVQVQDVWIPIYPKTGVEYPEVLDDVVSQLKKIANLASTQLTPKEPHT